MWFLGNLPFRILECRQSYKQIQDQCCLNKRLLYFQLSWLLDILADNKQVQGPIGRHSIRLCLIDMFWLMVQSDCTPHHRQFHMFLQFLFPYTLNDHFLAHQVHHKLDHILVQVQMLPILLLLESMQFYMSWLMLH